MARYMTCILCKREHLSADPGPCVFRWGLTLQLRSRACFSFPHVAMTGGSRHVCLKGLLLTLDLISIAAGLQQARHLWAFPSSSNGDLGSRKPLPLLGRWRECNVWSISIVTVHSWTINVLTKCFLLASITLLRKGGGGSKHEMHVVYVRILTCS